MVETTNNGSYGWKRKVIRADLSKETITVETADKYTKYIGGRGLIAKVMWDEVPAGTKAFDPENRLVFAAGPLTGTNSPMNGRWSVGSLAPQNPNEYPSHSSVGGHWGAELKFAGYDAIIVQGAAKKPVNILVIDDHLEIRNAGSLWGMDAVQAEKKIIDDLAKEQAVPNYANSQEKPQANKYDTKRVRSVVIGAAGENKSRIATILHDVGHQAGQNGFGGVMGSKNLKAISVRGTGSVPVARPKDMIEFAFRARKLIRAEAKPIVPPYGGPGGIYGGDPKILVSYIKRLDGCYGCQTVCRGFYANVPDCTSSPAMCVHLSMYYNWEGIGPVCPPHPDFINRPQDETAFYGINLADRLTLNGFELTGILSYLWAAYKAGILNEANTGISFSDFGSKAFADKLFGMIARREGEFGNLLAEGMHRAALQLKDKYGDKMWQLYEERYTAHGQRQHWFYVGSSKKPGDPTAYPNPIGQLLWATDTRDPYSNHSWTRETVGNQEKSKWFYGVAAAANPFDYLGKAQAAVVAQHHAALIDSLTFCDWFFPILKNAPFFSDEAKAASNGNAEKVNENIGDVDVEALLYSAATGDNLGIQDLLTVGERIFNLERAAQVRLGRSREDDTFNNYYFDHPDARGNKIDRSKWEVAKDQYYELRGWDGKTGVPTRATLERLGLKDVADALSL